MKGGRQMYQINNDNNMCRERGSHRYIKADRSEEKGVERD